MTLILDLAPEVERALSNKASHAGLPLDEYLRRVVERAAFEENGGNGKSPQVKAPPAQPIEFSHDRATRNAQILALAQASPEVFEATMRMGAEAMAPYYEASLAEGGELTELTAALQDEPFLDDDDD